MLITPFPCGGRFKRRLQPLVGKGAVCCGPGAHSLRPPFGPLPPDLRAATPPASDAHRPPLSSQCLGRAGLGWAWTQLTVGASLHIQRSSRAVRAGCGCSLRSATGRLPRGLQADGVGEVLHSFLCLRLGRGVAVDAMLRMPQGHQVSVTLSGLYLVCARPLLG